MYCVYILRNVKGRCYIGSSKDLKRRLKEHNRNAVSSTKNKGPFRLIYKEEFFTITEARKRENQIKNFKGNSKFKKLIEGSTLSSSRLDVRTKAGSRFQNTKFRETGSLV